MENSVEKVPVSAIVLTRNESANIEDCLKSCAFAQELLVIDDGSTDDTVAKAEALGARVLHRALAGDWGAQQTFSIENAKYPWVFLIDADERVSPELAQAVVDTVKKGKQNCWWVQRRNFYHEGFEAHGPMRPDWVARLMPKKDSRVTGKVHPAFVTPYPNKKLRTGHLIHHPYKDFATYLRKQEQYSTLAAEKYALAGRKCSFTKDIVVKPLWAFFKVYILNRGFLDGKYGFIFSVYHSWYTLTKYVKLYLKTVNNGKI